MTTAPAPASGRLLPSGRQVTITWSIPDRFGGMTAALLRRARSFVREGGADVDILTFDPRLDLPAAVEALRDRGELISGVRLRHIYDDVRRLDVVGPPVTVDPALRTATSPDESRVGEAGLAWWTSEGHTVRIEHRRADGTLALLDERRRTRGPRRLLTAFDPSGDASGQWTDAWTFYAWWLDRLLGDEHAFLIADSKTVAPFVQSYRRPHVTILHAVHGAHLRSGGARLDDTRKPMLENLHRWDAVVFLTERQRDDVASLMGDSGNLAVVPNGIDVPPYRRSVGARDPAHGVIVANLTGRKRLHHALEIIAAARAAGAPVTAEIIGDGPERAALEQRASRLGLDDAVEFGGYRVGAADRYAHASWTLITSRSEGAPLALLEAMARGCIPVAYDIHYGPADAIEPGRNGFLVADSDRDAAAAALVQLARTDAIDMREHARATARSHTDAEVVARWAQVQHDADRRRVHREKAALTLTRARVRRLRDRIRITARIQGMPRRTWVRAELSAPALLAPMHVPLRRIGRIAFGYLDRERTAELGRRALRMRVVVATAAGSLTLETGDWRPDPRTLPTRAAQRIRRAVRGRRPGQSSSSAGSSSTDATSATNRDMPSPSITR